jgi:hypothetical protein
VLGSQRDLVERKLKEIKLLEREGQLSARLKLLVAELNAAGDIAGEAFWATHGLGLSEKVQAARAELQEVQIMYDRLKWQTPQEQQRE